MDIDDVAEGKKADVPSCPETSPKVQDEPWKSNDSSDSEDGKSDYDTDEEEAQKIEEDPLYDPEADDQDEKWMTARREGRESDAILNCPGCFTTLCIDCQQHALYHHQFRAMFVMNVNVDRTQQLRAQEGSASGHAGGKRGRKGQSVQRSDSAAASEEKYHPVHCGVCQTEVGVYEPNEEIYTFFNIFPSNA